MKAIKITSEVILSGGVPATSAIVILNSFSGWTRQDHQIMATGIMYLSADSYKAGNDSVALDTKFGHTGKLMNVSIDVTEGMLENTTEPVISFMLNNLSMHLKEAKLENELIDI